jgi:hypothetical protein
VRGCRQNPSDVTAQMLLAAISSGPTGRHEQGFFNALADVGADVLASSRSSIPILNSLPSAE